MFWYVFVFMSLWSTSTATACQFTDSCCDTVLLYSSMKIFIHLISIMFDVFNSFLLWLITVILEAATKIKETTKNFALEAATENFSVSTAVNEESERCFSIMILKLLTEAREESVRCFSIIILKWVRVIEESAVLISWIFCCFLIVIDSIRSSIL